MPLSAGEQYLLELINRARLDPAGEAVRYDLDLNADLDAGTISTSAKQVLAPNQNLEASAEAHSRWMLDVDVFSHTGIDGSSPGDRIVDAGYTLSGRWSWRENLAWYGKTGSLDLDAAIETHHEGLYRSAGHRENTFAADIKEAGIAQVAGRFTNDGVTYNASMLTLNYGATGVQNFVTGVAYTDRDGDDFYSIGEGDAGLWLRSDDANTVTATAGGYGLGVTPDKAVTVTIGRADDTIATVDIDVSSSNAKLDLVTQTNGDQSLALSASATLVAGVTDAFLLGVANLNLTGNANDNALIGNAGRNTLRGEAGHDRLMGGEGLDKLYGGSGNDYIHGGGGRDGLNVTQTDTNNADLLSGGSGNDQLMGLSGFDVLDGGTGNDIMTGGGGRDTFIFNDGTDTITDFADNVDQITLNAAALGDADMTISEVLALGRVQDGDAVFDFGGGDVLILRDFTDIDALGNDLIIV